MIPKYDWDISRNVTNGRELHETRSREYVASELKRLGLEHISSILSSFKTQAQLERGL